MMQPTLQTCFCANSVKNFGQILKFAKLIKIDLRIFTFIFFFFTIGFIQAQTQSAFFEQWAHERGEQQFYFSAKSITDANKNVFVAGATINQNGNYDMLLTKYNPNGLEVWSTMYNGDFQGNDYPLDLKLDNQNNLFVTGSSQNGYDFENDYEAVLLKINVTGGVVWVRNLDGAQNGPDIGTTLDCDASGNVYFSGATSANSSLDYFISKYSSSGVLQWTNTYDYQNLYDGALKLKINGSYIVVSGISQSITGQIPPELRWEIATLRVSASNGQVLGSSRTGGSDEGMNTLTDLEIDNNGNIYLCGSVHNTGTGLDLKIAKLDDDLNIEWVTEYNDPANGNDEAESLILDSNGNVYVTGHVSNVDGNKDILTLKLNSSGAILWNEQYDSGYNNDDKGISIALVNNEPVVAATSYIISNDDYQLLHYNTSGILQNKINFNGAYNGDDKAIAVATDLNGDIVVVGQSQTDIAEFNYTTVKYSILDYIDPWYSQTISSTKYIKPNKGQLLKTNFQPASQVQFINDNDYPVSYVQKDKISYVFTRSDDASSQKFNSAHADTSVNWVVTDSLCRVDMEFSNARSPKFQPISTNRYYESYFLSHFDSKRIQTNNKAIAFGMWEDVDVTITNEESGLGIGFVCNPSFKQSALDWAYQGADSIAVSNGTTLTIYSPLGTLIYELNQAYQVNTNGQYVALSWTPTYQIINDHVKLSLGNFDTTLPLILTQKKAGAVAAGGGGTGNLEWSTFYGGSEQEVFYNITTDFDGNAYASGQSKSSNFPVTTGVVQFSHAMNLDIVVTKFNKTTLINDWATYYGGSAVDRGYGIDVDNENNVVFSGYTSSDNFPIENEIQPNGANNAAVVKLNPSGSTRIWATQIGPFDFTVSNDVGVDMDGNVYAVGRSFGDIDIFNQDGTASYNSGSGFILKIAPSGEPLWSTMFGHQAFCEIKGIAFDMNNNKYITGASRQPASQIGTNPNYSGTFGGGLSDAYIAKFNEDDNLSWSSWYGGNLIEEGEDIAVSQNTGNVVFVGGTMSSTGFPTLNPLPENSTFGGSSGSSPISGTDHHGDGFIAEFSSEGFHLFGSYFGGTHVDACLAVDYDAYNQIFMGGYTVSSADAWLTTTQGNISGLFSQSSFNGVGDAFVAAINPSKQLVWGSYFGGGSGDVGYGIATAANNKLYLTGWTESLGEGPNLFPLEDPIGTSDYFEGQLNLVNDFEGEIGDGFVTRFDIQPFSIVVNIYPVSNFKDKISIQPNPNNGNFTINNKLIGESKIFIFSSDGKKVFEDNLSELGESHQITVPNLQSGIYILTIITEKQSYYGKFSKL